MISSLYVSVSGMTSFAKEINVTSNNIANSETVGYKSSSVSFSDLLAESVTRVVGENNGNGVRVSAVSENWTQGSITDAESSTSLAIDGYGMFVLEDADTGLTYYTRDGTFGFDNTGTLTYTDGKVVQGYALDEDGNLGAMTDIQVSYANMPPQATTEMSNTTNLDSGSVENDTFETTITCYDSLGNEIPVTVTYTKTATANEWSWEATIPSDYGSVTSGGSGTLTFDSNGVLTSGTDPAIELTLTNGAANQTITWDLYEDSGASNGNLTQYASTSANTDIQQDGYTTGEVSSIEIDSDGTIVISYTNDLTLTPYRIAMADFNNYNGLKKTDGNLYMSTRESGQAIYGVANAGKLGSINASSQELSNVDLATELTQLISTQTAYKGCSRAFTVTNELLEVLVNLK